MLIIPAIDLKDHKVVRLQRGLMDQNTIYSDNPLDMAKKWIDQGAVRLHLVDLNGAFEGKSVHHKEVEAIAKQFPHVAVEVGGGLRSFDAIKKYMEHGVTYCILGTVIVKDPDLVFKACDAYPHKIILGVDAKEGFVATEGWDEASQVTSLGIVSRFQDQAIESVIYTDIARDGMLSSMSFDQIEKMKNCGFPVIASGGLTSLEDIRRLVKMGDVYGVIAGKALYEGLFSIKEALLQLADIVG